MPINYTLSAEKLCPHCNKWTFWDETLDCTCNHCNGILKHEEVEELRVKEEKKRKLEFQFKEKWPFTVQPEDNLIVKGAKHIGYGVYFVVMSVLMAFLWFTFWVVS